MKFMQWALIVLSCVFSLSCRNVQLISADSEEELENDPAFVEVKDTGTGGREDTEPSDAKDTGSGQGKDTGHPDTGPDEPMDTEPSGPRESDGKALVMIVDNSQSMSIDALEALYADYPDEIGGVLAEMYGQPKSEITSRSLTEIAEDFGEDWIIADIEANAQGHYDEYGALTDSRATLDNFISAIEYYSKQGLSVDVLIHLHGNAMGEIGFYDGTYPVEVVTEIIRSDNLNVSVVYQTLCYGSEMVDEWADIGIHGVNGSVRDNIYVNFAPGAFLKHWISGADYDDAVQQARTDDITELQTRLTTAAADNIEFLFALALFDFNAQSTQVVDGEFPNIRW